MTLQIDTLDIDGVERRTWLDLRQRLNADGEVEAMPWRDWQALPDGVSRD
jgi:hypothetical protein